MTVNNRVITDGSCDPYPYCIIQDQNHYPTVFQQKNKQLLEAGSRRDKELCGKERFKNTQKWDLVSISW